MKYVEIYKLQNDGSQTVEAMCQMDSDEVKCTGNPRLIARLTEDGVRALDGAQVFPKDGLRFLEALRYECKSGYLNASHIKEH